MSILRTGLVQTVGWETLPSIVAALAMRPHAVAHIHMPDSADASARSVGIIKAELGPIPILQRVVGIEDPLLESREAVAALIVELKEKHGCERVIVHVTGSTKLVAIGAFESARAAGTECLYLELPKGDEDGVPQVISLGTGRLTSEELAALGMNPSTRMSLELIARAHGYEISGRGLDFDPYIAFARHALEDDGEEQAMHFALPAKGGGRSPWPADPAWREWLSAFSLPRQMERLAMDAGIVEPFEGRVRLVEPGEQAADVVRRSVLERHASLLRGAWLEVALADAMVASPVLRDVRWSVEAELPRPMEHDVLALKGTTLVVASAKRSTQPGIFGHLRELRAHAHRLGGMMGIPVLAVARMDWRRREGEERSVGDDLLEVAQSLGVRMISREAICRRDLSGVM